MLHGLPIDGVLLSCNRRRDVNISPTVTDPSDRLRDPSIGDIGGDSDGGVESSKEARLLTVALGLRGEKGEIPVSGSSMRVVHGGTCTIMLWWFSSPTIFLVGCVF
ncbi:hypothetical protein HanIR_Chr06g0268271 [Helianthus annuus]|nr:hypothetical protein HanIR_Chr06g0268271 [Helianthus annuus]